MKGQYLHNVPQLFEETVERYPRNKALLWTHEESIRYEELDKICNQVARFLLDSGVGKGDRVCVRLDKCTLAYSIILACLKIGAPYFILDPANPRPRTEYILGKCEPAMIFTSEDIEDLGTGSHVQKVDIPDDQFGFLKGYSEKKFRPDWEIAGSDAAYIMFTSGSTGFPKGAVMSHDNLLHFINWTQWQFKIKETDIFTNVNPLFFDNSVFDIYSSLFNGAALVPFDSAMIRDPYKTVTRINELGCTIYFSVPSLLVYFQTLKLMTPKVFKGLQKIIFGGEGYPLPRFRELYECFGERIELYNVYGPTECTCICSVYQPTREDLDVTEGYLPLGGLIPNFSYSILGENDSRVPTGEVGELCLTGPCVGLGYFNEPELTQKAFVQNPLNRRYLEKIYKTGDLVRYCPHDGKIRFIGRKDDQIKHQGYRIELGEIEHALTRIPGVDEAVALHTYRNGISQILAVVASRSGNAGAKIRQEVSRLVPRYMVPEEIEVLERLPKNANGKTDRNLLKEKYCGQH